MRTATSRPSGSWNTRRVCPSMTCPPAAGRRSTAWWTGNFSRPATRTATAPARWPWMLRVAIGGVQIPDLHLAAAQQHLAVVAGDGRLGNLDCVVFRPADGGFIQFQLLRAAGHSRTKQYQFQHKSPKPCDYSSRPVTVKQRPRGKAGIRSPNPDSAVRLRDDNVPGFAPD